jgi:cobalt/nickel transport system permease protein
MFRTSGKEELEAGAAVHTSLASVQEKTAFLPDYGFKKAEAVPETPEAAEDVPAAWPRSTPELLCPAWSAAD